tara:strand:+ start:8573 stop:9064 length:492 start_codon:yes stop_codon:yes gene_type:complete
MIIGIDNGLKGGICAIDKATGKIVETFKMPVQHAHGANEVDVYKLIDLLSELSNGFLWEGDIVIEKPGGSKSARAAKSMAGSLHAIRGAIESRGISLHRITPQSWQKVLIPGKGDTKKRALAKANSLWPGTKWPNINKTERCYRPHDGIIDAALIAYYWRTKQ